MGKNVKVRAYLSNTKKNKRERRCCSCGRMFYVPPNVVKVGKGKYCSVKCRRRDSFGQRVKRFTITCETCKKVFFKSKKAIIKDNCKFCCRRCWILSRKGKLSGSFGKTWTHTKEYRRKLSLARRGDKNPGWKGGKSPKQQRFRNSKKNKVWRKRVVKKYKGICQMCYIKPRSPVAHHINSFIEYPEYRHIVANGVVLCRKCHKIVHKGNL